MNKRNLKQLSPRPFPKRQYMKLTHKIGLYLVLPILLIIIGGGIGGTCYYRNYHHPHQNVHEHAQKRPATPKTKHVNHQPKTKLKLKPINVKQGEHLIGHWLKQLHYPAARAQAILTNYQKQNENKELKFSQTLNQLTHGAMNNRTKVQRIRKLINQL